MEHRISQYIVDVINDRRTWIAADLCPRQIPYQTITDGEINVCYSSCIKLRVLVAGYGYRKRHQWTIPELVIEKAARKIKEEDKDFWYRFIHCRMTSKDVEHLIRDSTYGLVNLELYE
jgi:hypothetical protein